MTTQRHRADSEVQTLKKFGIYKILAYPIDMSSFLIPPRCTFDTQSVPFDEGLNEYHPTTIAQCALAHWNHYLTTHDGQHRRAFMAQVHWLIENVALIDDNAAGWLISSPRPNVYTNGSWLSALTQGNMLSALARAYRLSSDNLLLEVAKRIVRTFERDILDGGISTPIGEGGIFFEEVAIYPASHKLSGFIFSLFGLYDYVGLTGDASIKQLIRDSLTTMHLLLDEFDVGFWTRSDLMHGDLASPAHLALQVELLEALAMYSRCDHCSALAARWRKYQRQVGSRLYYFMATRCSAFGRASSSGMRRALFPALHHSHPASVCIPMTSFPFTGGILTVLEGIAQVTKGFWDIEYLAQIIGPDAEKHHLHRFGNEKTAPWHFPLVWLYFLFGMRELVSLLRRGADYQVILPQDGLFTAAFSALVGKLAGIRVVCIDHSTLTWPGSRIYRAERAATVKRKRWHWTLKLLALLMLKLYWPSISLLAHISAHFVDHFLIPGIAGDEMEEVCNALGVRYSRLTRFNSMIDVHRHVLLDAESRACMREKKGIAADAIVVAIICRLAPEKGLEVAMQSIDQALSTCSSDARSRLRIVIAGDGPLGKYLEEDIQRRQLHQTCILWGSIPAEEVITLLGMSDIFLYTSVRGACFPMSVLEAMASGCAVIASAQPLSNALLLAEGRGVEVPVDDAEQTSAALTRLINDLELCKSMGQLARSYVAAQHSPTMFRRVLLRTTGWSGLNEMLAGKAIGEATTVGGGAD